jgi:hypothetical protein
MQRDYADPVDGSTAYPAVGGDRWTDGMADIGPVIREIDVEPAEEPVPAPVEVPEHEPEPVGA